MSALAESIDSSRSWRLLSWLAVYYSTVIHTSFWCRLLTYVVGGVEYALGIDSPTWSIRSRHERLLWYVTRSWERGHGQGREYYEASRKSPARLSLVIMLFSVVRRQIGHNMSHRGSTNGKSPCFSRLCCLSQLKHTVHETRSWYFCWTDQELTIMFFSLR